MNDAQTNQQRCFFKILLPPTSSLHEMQIGRFVTFEKNELRISCDQALPSGKPISVQYEDMLFLGEILSCSALIGETWTVLIKVEQLLTALDSLLRLREQLVGVESSVLVSQPRLATLAA